MVVFYLHIPRPPIYPCTRYHSISDDFHNSPLSAPHRLNLFFRSLTPQHICLVLARRINAIRIHTVGGHPLPRRKVKKVPFSTLSERGRIVMNTTTGLLDGLVYHGIGCGSWWFPGGLLCRIAGYRYCFWRVIEAVGTPGCSIAYHALSKHLMIKWTSIFPWEQEIVWISTGWNSLTRSNGLFSGMFSGIWSNYSADIQISALNQVSKKSVCVGLLPHTDPPASREWNNT